MAEAFGIACHELVSIHFRCGSKADVGEARSITNQAGHYGCTPLVPWELLAWPTPTTGPPKPHATATAITRSLCAPDRAA